MSLTAHYTSPTTTHTFPQPPLTTTTTTPPGQEESRTAALAHLHTTLRALQSDINTFLTARMADDKADVDAKAEDYYGEELVDDDE